MFSTGQDMTQHRSGSCHDEMVPWLSPTNSLESNEKKNKKKKKKTKKKNKRRQRQEEEEKEEEKKGETPPPETKRANLLAVANDRAVKCAP